MKIPITPMFLISALLTQVLSVPVDLPADVGIPDPESVQSRVQLHREASPFTNEHAHEAQSIPGASDNTPTEETRNLANSDLTDDQGPPEGTPTKKRGHPGTSAARKRNSDNNRGEIMDIKTHQELVDYYQLPDPPNARKVKNRQRVRRLDVARMRADAAAAGIEIPEDLEELFAVRTSNKGGEESVTRTRVATNPTHEELNTLNRQEKFPGHPKLLPQSPPLGVTNERGSAQEARIPTVEDYRRMHKEAARAARKQPMLLPKPEPPKKSNATQEQRTQASRDNIQRNV
ncbi:hypothetical protein H0H93_014872 [Arthromyces matolae]|nr:hypothetical protein H0H93_014872 [Arthromyces matolae]